MTSKARCRLEIKGTWKTCPRGASNLVMKKEYVEYVWQKVDSSSMK